MMNDRLFLSCDWGTSAFRLRLIRVNDLQVIAEIKNNFGILYTFQSWQQSGNSSNRVAFYTTMIQAQLQLWSSELNISLKGVPIILSGMASSTMGLIELPYKEMPFRLDGSDLEVRWVHQSGDLNPLLIISGVSTADDVMRGEETKIVGCASLLPHPEQEQLLILPGTHPKHVILKNHQVIGFQTFMTGEFFDLLSSKSILSESVDKGGNLNDPENRSSFVKAVETSQTTALMHHSFLVRTNRVLKHLPKQQNFYYLSGLLIGAELNGLNRQIPVYLLGGMTHIPLYTLACEVLGIHINQSLDADHCLIKGQQVIFQHMSHRG